MTKGVAEPRPSAGRYWYDCLFLPTGVRAELVTLDGTPGVRFCFTTLAQADALTAHAKVFAERIANGSQQARQQGEDIEPPLVGENNV